MKRFAIIGCSLFFLLAIAACGNDTSSEGEELNEEPVEEVESEMEPETEPERVEEDIEQETEQNEPTNTGAIDAAEIKDIPVYVEGETEMRPAQFHRSGLGYGIYLLEDFMLDSEEPNRDVIVSQFDESFFTRVTNHSTDANADELKQTIIDHAEGESTDAIDVPLDGVEFALIEEVTSNNETTSIIHVAKNYNGELIGFTMFLPQKEAVEGLAPSMWAMLETIEY